MGVAEALVYSFEGSLSALARGDEKRSWVPRLMRRCRQEV